MKPQIVTQGIVLARTDFQEADRILTVLTPEHGKLRVIAKGVRRPKSKLAGGIELFSINDLTILPSKSDIKTLVSSRLVTHYGNIVKDIQRTMYGYEVLKQLSRYTEDQPEPEYFHLLASTFEGLNDQELDLPYVELWFAMQLLKVSGHTPNLQTDTEDNKLSATDTYLFDFESSAFRQHTAGIFTANHIKLLRLANGSNGPQVFMQVQNADKPLPDILSLAKKLLRNAIG